MNTWSKLVLIGSLSLASIPSARATNVVAGGDEGHGAGVTMDNTPTVSVAGDRTSSSFLTGFYTHQVPLRVYPATNGLLNVMAAAVAWAPIFSGTHPTQQVQGRLLAWRTNGTLLCATSTSTWTQSASSVENGIGTCTMDPGSARAEAEFSLGNEQNQLKATYPRLFSVIYAY